MEHVDNSAYMSVFLAEADEQLQLLEEHILSMEQNGAGMEVVQLLFRAAHTLKGSSAAMGFEHMKQLTHRMESILDSIRRERLQARKPVINLLLECTDTLQQMRDAIAADQSDSYPIGDLLARLERMEELPAADVEFVPSRTCQSAGPAEDNHLRMDAFQRSAVLNAIHAGFQVYDVRVRLSANTQMKAVRAFQVYHLLTERGELLAAAPSIELMELEEHIPGEIEFIVATAEPEDVLQRAVQGISDVASASVMVLTLDQLNQSDNEVIHAPAHLPADSPRPAAGAAPSTSDSRSKPAQTTVRVDVNRLTALMNLVGELVIEKTRLADVNARLADELTNDQLLEPLQEVSSRMNRIVNELQDGMMKTRMYPIEQLFNRFPRMIRDMALQIGKEVDFRIEGKETELDRTLIEEIGDPIIHLLRNALDHGIEAPDERERLGKPRRGKLLLEAAHEENHIVITVSDDGRGIDGKRVLESAVGKGLLGAEEAERLSEPESIQLIFRSGFSTARQVTDLSGRGVGMDIVRSHLEQLNGLIHIDTQLGQGTTFTIKLPLTMAITRSLLVKLDEQIYAIPLAHVLEIVRLDSKAIQSVQNKKTAVIRGQIYPLVQLKDKLGMAGQAQDVESPVYAVIVGLAEKRAALVVDRTLGNQEIVMKSLGRLIGSPRHIAGATIMGDGQVCLIADIQSIIREEGRQAELQTRTDDEGGAGDMELVAFRMCGEEYGAEVEYVRDIMTMPAITPVLSKDASMLGVMSLRGNVIPVIDLRKKLGLASQGPRSASRVMVLDVQGRMIGAMVDEVTQVLKADRGRLEPSKDPSSAAAPGKVSHRLYQINDRLITLLDLEQLFRQEGSEPTATAQ